MTTTEDVRWLMHAVHPAPGPLPALHPGREGAVAALAERHRLTALLASRSTLAGFPPALAAALRPSAARIAARNLAFTRELLSIVRAARQAGVVLVPFKGPLLAAQAYGSLALREFDDLDVLTGRAQLPAAARVLESLGYRLVHDGKHAADALSLPAEYHFPFQHPVTGCCVELHAEVAPAGFARPSWRDVSSRLTGAELGGGTVTMLSSADLLLVLCVHATKHLWGCLEFLTAIAHLIHRQPPDWAEVEHRAQLSGTARFLETALSLIGEWMPGIMPADPTRGAAVDPSISRSWIEAPAAPAILRRPAFHLRAHGAWTRRLHYAAAALLAPNWDDFRWLPLPRRWQFLYPVVRVARLATTHTPTLLRSLSRRRS